MLGSQVAVWIAGALVLVALVVCKGYAQEDRIPEFERVFVLPSSDAGVDTMALLPSLLPRQHLRWHSTITNLPSDWFSAAGQAVRPSGLRTLAAVAVLTGVLVMTDQQTYSGSQRLYETSPAVRHLSDGFVHVGDGAVHLGVAGAFGAYGLIASDRRAVRTASQTVEALLATGIAVQIFKRMAGRESPEMATADRGIWRPFPSLHKYQKNQPRYYAFPSGHIATTMATITVLAENYPDARWIRPVGYSLLAGVGVGLVNVKYHWYSDLPLGILLGYSLGMAVSHHDSPADESPEPNSAHLVFQPTVTGSGAGVSFTMIF